MQAELLHMTLARWALLAAAWGLAVLAGHLAAWISLGVASRIASRTAARWDDLLVKALRGPARFLASVGLAFVASHAARPDAAVLAWVVHALTLLLIVACAWLGVRLVGFAATMIEERATEAASKSDRADASLRGLRTRIVVLRRIAGIAVGLLAAAIALLQFDAVRTVGLSMLASAGVAGIVLGLAAQKPMTALLTGIQLSITQPVRIGDTVIMTPPVSYGPTATGITGAHAPMSETCAGVLSPVTITRARR